MAAAVALAWPWPVRVQVRVRWHADEPFTATARVAVWGIRVWMARLPAPAGRVRGRGRPATRGVRHGARTLLPPLLRAARYFHRHVRVYRFAWRACLGLPEADLSALGATLVNLGVSAAALAASRARPARPLEVETRADYQRSGIDTRLDCIFAISPAHAMIAGVLAAGEFLRRRRVRRQGVGRVGRASHRHAHENRDGEHKGNGQREHRGR